MKKVRFYGSRGGDQACLRLPLSWGDREPVPILNPDSDPAWSGTGLQPSLFSGCEHVEGNSSEKVRLLVLLFRTRMRDRRDAPPPPQVQIYRGGRGGHIGQSTAVLVTQFDPLGGPSPEPSCLQTGRESQLTS